MTDNRGLLIAGVGEIGSAGDGKHIYFELIFPSDHRDRFRISFSDMDAVVLGLQAALVAVATVAAFELLGANVAARIERLAGFIQ